MKILISSFFTLIILCRIYIYGGYPLPLGFVFVHCWNQWLVRKQSIKQRIKSDIKDRITVNKLSHQNLALVNFNQKTERPKHMPDSTIESPRRFDFPLEGNDLADDTQAAYLEDFERTLTNVHQGNCPCCSKSGPVDVHYSYRVISFVTLTRYEEIPKICCCSCARKRRLSNFFITLLLGWWSFAGIILTPICLIRNLMFPVSRETPSEDLRKIVKKSYNSRLRGLRRR